MSGYYVNHPAWAVLGDRRSAWLDEELRSKLFDYEPVSVFDLRSSTRLVLHR